MDDAAKSVVAKRAGDLRSTRTVCIVHDRLYQTPWRGLALLRFCGMPCGIAYRDAGLGADRRGDSEGPYALRFPVFYTPKEEASPSIGTCTVPSRGVLNKGVFR